LIAGFLEKFNSPDRPVREFTEEVVRQMMAHDWPGNVRELENAVERAIALNSTAYLSWGDLPASLNTAATYRPPVHDELLPLEELERRAIMSTLRQSGGDKQAAAKVLGIGKTTLYRKLKQYQIQQAPE
jgi:two-component system response regulator HydG